MPGYRIFTAICATVSRRGAVHLGQRRGGQGFSFEATEARQRVGAEGLAQATLDLGERTRRNFVLQRLQGLAERGGQEGPDHAQHLPHLDEHAAQAREALGQAPRVLEMGALQGGACARSWLSSCESSHSQA